MSPTSDTAQILNALPPQWIGPAILAVGVLHLGMQFCQYAANHRGVCGMWQAFLHGKNPNP